MAIRCRRIHEPASPEDGIRVLVDRVWPRGIRKADARLDHWFRDVAPSTALRKWFAHDPARFEEFRQRYRVELESEPERLPPLMALARSGTVTLLYAARDTRHNQAMVLADLLREQLCSSLDEPASATCYAEEFPDYMGYGRSQDER